MSYYIYLKDNKVIEDVTSVGVATPYKAQQILLKDLMKEWNLHEDIVTGTVHRYQGDQKRIMIFDIPDSEGTQPSKLIKSTNIR